ncbi:MAG: hypothetical protein HRT53_20680 [Colwellia sp.]|nr:hypothetical protein [Colwellia sp.]
MPGINNSNWAALTKLPYWLAKPSSELDKLRQASVVFWLRFSNMLAWPAAQLDPMTAEIELVHLLAWERDIEQIPQETEQLYRTRVKYALKFAKGAGSKDGWYYMFKKLGIPKIRIEERMAHADWDVVRLQLLDSDLAQSPKLIENIIKQYGRTCRRYEFANSNTVKVNVAVGFCNVIWQSHHIKS